MRFEILGPLRIIDGDRSITIRARKVQVLLVTLLIRSEQVVSLDQLVSEIWNYNPPRRATAALYVYISQLRKLLDRSDQGRNPIVTRAPGYLFCPGTDEIDLNEFQCLIGQGRAASRAERHDVAAAKFGAALALCRGPVLSDLRDGPVVTGFATWFEEAQLECVEKMVEAELALGHHREMVGFLFEQIREHPLHEIFYRQLMLGLYHSERRADALNIYQLARRTLQDELGLEPGRPLQELQRHILMADEPVGDLAV